MSSVATMPKVRGRLTPNAPLAPLVWFKSGGTRGMAVRAGGRRRPRRFPAELDPDVPVMALGLGSNLIVRDGGVPGVVVRLGKAFARIEQLDDNDAALRRRRERHPRLLDRARRRDRRPRIPARHPGHGRRLRADERRRLRPRGPGHPRLGEVVLRSGELIEWPLDRLGYTYRHSEVPEGAVVVEATFRGTPGEPEAIGAEMDAIARAREESQPLRSRTGGSTFKNPPGHKAWALVDAAGCRGLRIGDAQVSEKHCNFLLNLGSATSADIEALGEEVRRRVLAKSNITLEWEIQRVGERMNKDLHVVVLMGGWSAEREVSLISGDGVAEALASGAGPTSPSSTWTATSPADSPS